jgi:hypothetical protein
MTPEQRLQKVTELNEKARLSMINENHVPEKPVGVWVNGLLVPMPKTIADKYNNEAI